MSLTSYQRLEIFASRIFENDVNQDDNVTVDDLLLILGAFSSTCYCHCSVVLNQYYNSMILQVLKPSQ